MKRTTSFRFLMSKQEKAALKRLAQDAGNLSQGALVRRLIVQEARKLGLYKPPEVKETTL